MLKCARPPNKECPYNAKLNECQVGFGDDMFCKPCMKQQREYRNNTNKEPRNAPLGPELTKLNANYTANVCISDTQSSRKSTQEAANAEICEPVTGVTNGTVGNAIVQPVLAYMVFALQSGTITNIKNAIIGHFTLDQIIQAKDTLWLHCGNEVIGEKQKRKESNSRSAKEAHVSDLLSAWSKLDRADATPVVLINAFSLSLIPRSHPEELHSISVIDRLNQMEKRMDNMVELLDRTVAENLVLKEKVDNIPASNSYANSLKKDLEKTKGSQQKQPISSIQSTAMAKIPVTTALLAQCSSDNRDSDSEGYEIPSYQKKKVRRMQKRQRVVLGTASPSSSLVKGAPPPRRDFFVFRLDKSTTAEQLLMYLNDKDVSPIDAVEVSHPHSKFKSFKVTVSITNAEKILNPECWPRGIGVRRYRAARNQENQPPTLS